MSAAGTAEKQVPINSGIATFITGLISLLKFKDRSSVVKLAVVLGSLALFMVLMELIEGISYALK